METHFPWIESAASRRARQRVLADLRSLADDAEELLRSTASDVGEKMIEARSRLSAALESAKSTCVNLQEQGVASVKLATRKADATIRAHPYETLGAAFGVGVVLGLLMRRR